MSRHNISKVAERYVLILAQCEDCQDYDWYVSDTSKKAKTLPAIRLEEFLRLRKLIA